MTVGVSTNCKHILHTRNGTGRDGVKRNGPLPGTRSRPDPLQLQEQVQLVASKKTKKKGLAELVEVKDTLCNNKSMKYKDYWIYMTSGYRDFLIL